MKIDITKLKSNIIDSIDIDESILYEEYMQEKGILNLENVKVTGYLSKLDEEDYYLNVRVYGKMILPCSVSLKPTDYNFDIEIDGNVAELLEEMGKNEKKVENTIDIFPIIWENILMEIPIHIVNEDIHDVKLEGEGWKFITGDEPKINPELEKLKDLLK